MTERARLFLSQLEETDRKFVHIECDILLEAIAEAKAQATDECMEALLAVLEQDGLLRFEDEPNSAFIDAVRARLS